MQVNLHSNQGNQFSSYSENSVTINQLEYSENILVSAQEIKPLALNSIDDLNQEVLNQLIAMQPDIIIFGTGNKIKYPPTKLLLQLQNKQIGFEIMPIPALCRTFNYLIGEGRKVLGMIIFN